jgi:hypothetical protein
VKTPQNRMSGAMVAVFIVAMLFSLPFFARADSSPSERFAETFASYDHADGARTTAWWDRGGERLTLSQPDAGNERRWPALSVTEDSGILVVWVEDRGAGPHIWGQRLDRHGNRLWDDDRMLAAWQEAWPAADLESRRLAISQAPGGQWLVWSDESGAWASFWPEEVEVVGTKTQIDVQPGADVTIDCQGDICSVIVVGWETTSAGFLAENGTYHPLKTTHGELATAWHGSGDLWLVWRENGDTRLGRYAADSWLPVWDEPVLIRQNDNGPLDLTAASNDVWLLAGAPLQVMWLQGGEVNSLPVQQNVWTLAEAAVRARIVATQNWVSVVWQTTEPGGFWARWISLTGDALGVDARLLRLNFPGQIMALGDVAATNDGSTAVAWTENNEVFTRRWELDGLSTWRHEVAPGYVPAPGWTVYEGLGHSLPVNEPWQGITSATLNATLTYNGGSVQFYVSNQGPRAWQAVEPGQRIVFDEMGNELRWYVRLRRSVWGTAPEIKAVTLDYDYLWRHNLPSAHFP